MSKINQIQNSLRELSQGAFQKLADAYLHQKGYDKINSLGSVIGADKTRKGTPDTYVSRPNGKYVFVEHTTQQTGLYDKLNADLDKCFDEAITGVPIEKIEEVVFCHTSVLSVDEENTLAEKCRFYDVNLNIFGLSSISLDLYHKYPGLAKDILDIEIDTGQIVSHHDFVTLYNKNKLATRLDTNFHFREEEIKQILIGLDEADLIFIAGRAGVGKTRLALECCKKFCEKHAEYKFSCIFNKGIDLFEDLKVHYSAPGNYLILVDDANRISRFDYIIQLLQERQEGIHLKVLVTVRDYALNKVRQAAKSYNAGVEVELIPLDEKQIKQLVVDEYGINNHLYLDRIWDISQGNPRLAIMAAQIVKRKGTWQSIVDVSALYDEYFISIRKDLEEIGNENLLKVAGVVAFFRVVDRTNEQLMSAIQEAFKIAPSDFWTGVKKLHDMEVLDVYEDEVARTADQVLATYLFYLSVFKERLLDFGVFLKSFFPAQRSRFVEAINPVLSAFNSPKLTDIMRPKIDEAWADMEKGCDSHGLRNLIEVFWFLKQTDTLIYLKKQIEGIEVEALDISSLDFKATSDVQSLSLLNIIELFRWSEKSNFEIALNLLLDLLEKKPSELPKVLHLINNQFSFEPESYAIHYSVQKSLVDVVWTRSREAANEFIARVLIATTDSYLSTHYHSARYKGGHKISWIKFHLPPTEDVFELRKSMLSRLFKLYNKQSLRHEILNVILNYSRSGFKVSGKEIIATDATEILPFIESELNPVNYDHCVVANEYLDFLEEREVEFDKSIRDRFRSKIYILSELILLDFAEKRTLHLDFEQYREFKLNQIKEYFKSYRLNDYESFFQQCLEIQKGLDQNHVSYQFQIGVVDVLIALSERNPNLYVDVIEHYLNIGEPLCLLPYQILQRLITLSDCKSAFDVINQPIYSTKRRWLLCYYEVIPVDKIQSEHLNHLYLLYREASPVELPQNLDYLLKFRDLDKQVILRITSIVLEKAEKDNKYLHAISMLFNFTAKINKALIEIFSDNLELLKRAYFSVLDVDQHMDFDGRTFQRIINHDAGFATEYINQMYNKKKWIGRHDDTRDYSFLWIRNDFDEIMKGIIDQIYAQEVSGHILPFSYVEAFFRIKEPNKDIEKLIEKQDRLLTELIEQRCEDVDFMAFIFLEITVFPVERRRKFLRLFLEKNKNFESFKKLPLETSLLQWSGSPIPMHEGRVNYLESILPLLDTVDYLQHKQFIERKIQGIRQDIENEKKAEFIED